MPAVTDIVFSHLTADGNGLNLAERRTPVFPGWRDPDLTSGGSRRRCRDTRCFRAAVFNQPAEAVLAAS